MALSTCPDLEQKASDYRRDISSYESQKQSLVFLDIPKNGIERDS
jgi:hypothetical protein